MQWLKSLILRGNGFGIDTVEVIKLLEVFRFYIYNIIPRFCVMLHWHPAFNLVNKTIVENPTSDS